MHVTRNAEGRLSDLQKQDGFPDWSWKIYVLVTTKENRCRCRSKRSVRDLNGCEGKVGF